MTEIHDIPMDQLRARRPGPEDHDPALAERLRRRQETAEGIAGAFAAASETLRDIDGGLLSRSGEAVARAAALVDRIAGSILCAPEIAIQVMGESAGSEEVHLHPLNVALLSLLVAREIGLAPEAVRTLGLGALFHDIGRRAIPAAVFTKMDPLTGEERQLYEMHCRYGADIGRQLGLDPGVVAIIHEHHEYFDGSGYPDGRAGEAIGVLSRIVVIANFYDELCNPANVAEALIPHEALSAMYARFRSRFDPDLLQAFVRCLGVYPPGTVVQLSNGIIGMVATVNAAKPLKPLVLAYDPTVPREEAPLVDLEREPDLNVAKAIRPGQLPREIYQYLSPRRRVSYYFDAPGPGQELGR